jgi:hypothetical protein
MSKLPTKKEENLKLRKTLITIMKSEGRRKGYKIEVEKNLLWLTLSDDISIGKALKIICGCINRGFSGPIDFFEGGELKIRFYFPKRLEIEETEEEKFERFLDEMEIE